MVAFLSVLLAVLVGSIMILATDEEVRGAAGYITARPGDFFSAAREAITGAYGALFRGSIYNIRAEDFQTGIRPLTETLKFAAPLITAGLGVGLAFRAGLFNIGGRGQMLLAGGAAGWVGTQVDLPFPLHLVVAVAAGMLAGALWAGLAGLLKARTGAHEVIVTIMLNYVGFYLVFYALSTQGILQAPGSINPKSLPMDDSAVLPKLAGDRYNLHLGFLLALVAVVVVWWLLSRSSLGYRLRAVGVNPNAARTSGIDVGRTYVIVMLIAGALVGLAGANQVLGTVTSGVTSRSRRRHRLRRHHRGPARPVQAVGILVAGLLFERSRPAASRCRPRRGCPSTSSWSSSRSSCCSSRRRPWCAPSFRLPAKEAK